MGIMQLPTVSKQQYHETTPNWKFERSYELDSLAGLFVVEDTGDSRMKNQGGALNLR